MDEADERSTMVTARAAARALRADREVIKDGTGKSVLLQQMAKAQDDGPSGTTSSPSSTCAKRRMDSLSWIASTACGSDRLNHCWRNSRRAMDFTQAARISRFSQLPTSVKDFNSETHDRSWVSMGHPQTFRMIYDARRMAVRRRRIDR
jgi:hypothetical protein